MNRIQLSPTDALALVALTGLGIGAALVQGIGWGLIVVCALVLVYIVLPDQGGPKA